MDNFLTIFLWIMGIFVALSGAGITAYVSLIQRIVKLETTLSLIGLKAARILHSTDDHHGLDALLDKYIDRHYELSYGEWQQLLENCELIEEDVRLSKQERTLAAIVSAVCHHKLKHPPRSTGHQSILSDPTI